MLKNRSLLQQMRQMRLVFSRHHSERLRGARWPRRRTGDGDLGVTRPNCGVRRKLDVQIEVVGFPMLVKRSITNWRCALDDTAMRATALSVPVTRYASKTSGSFANSSSKVTHSRPD